MHRPLCNSTPVPIPFCNSTSLYVPVNFRNIDLDSQTNVSSILFCLLQVCVCISVPNIELIYLFDRVNFFLFFCFCFVLLMFWLLLFKKRRNRFPIHVNILTLAFPNYNVCFCTYTKNINTCFPCELSTIYQCALTFHWKWTYAQCCFCCCCKMPSIRMPFPILIAYIKMFPNINII